MVGISSQYETYLLKWLSLSQEQLSGVIGVVLGKGRCSDWGGLR